ncbi:hypothetical protein HME7025_00071 [Aquirufa nivalisilvae]|uniref:Uncharacterized protein n=1 Tax=Aquirufa nivalisilvae TaxID=2516557 RepID=A0A2S2DRE3_9BACT|nr:hypothetical protein [Aquirufa nivalisilvae]AWL07956.1 hypothetical protein HME7025_00071 [Aquirufa nivalisilvae]
MKAKTKIHVKCKQCRNYLPVSGSTEGLCSARHIIHEGEINLCDQFKYDLEKQTEQFQKSVEKIDSYIDGVMKVIIIVILLIQILGL